MSVLLDRIMEGSMVLLIIGIFLAFARAVRGPRFTDRIVAINMIGTMTTAIICILSAYLKEDVYKRQMMYCVRLRKPEALNSKGMNLTWNALPKSSWMNTAVASWVV